MISMLLLLPAAEQVAVLRIVTLDDGMFVYHSLERNMHA